MTVVLSYPWQQPSTGIWQAGKPSSSLPADSSLWREWLLKQRVHFGCVIENDDFIFACVDRTRSYPIFFVQHAQQFLLSDHPQKLLEYVGQAPDSKSIALYLTSGYCPAERTFYQSVHQLQAGEYLLWDKKQKKLEIISYYHYVPLFPVPDPTIDYKKKLGEVLDRAIARVIAQADGRQICVPLSGGLDSRLVLCKLHELGYKNIKAFSYGADGNTEAETAKKVAQDLGISWEFIAPNYKQQNHFFNSEDGQSFIREASRGCNGPSFTDFFALQTLASAKKIGAHTLIVNGQSGDYLTGGHLPQIEQKDSQLILNAFTQKHFALWRSLVREQEPYLNEFMTHIQKKFAAINTQNFSSEIDYFYAFHSWLEWRERQCKYVVSCQYNYDYFKADWALPLWDSDLMDFYQQLPFDLYFGQKLYIEYLQSWNYCEQFSFIRTPYNPWPKNRLMILGIGRLLGMIAGTKAKDCFYQYARYWSSHDVHYKLMTLNQWNKNWEDLVNAEGFYALIGLLSANIDISPLAADVPAYHRFLKEKHETFK